MAPKISKEALEISRELARNSEEFKHFVPITRSELIGTMIGTGIISGLIGFGACAAIRHFRGIKTLEVIEDE